MPYLSVKESNNRLTINNRNSNLAEFLCVENQRFLTKKIYSLHKMNNGAYKYLYFKIKIPSRVKQWIKYNDINNFNGVIFGGINTLEFINKKFISDNYDLYTFNDNFSPLEANVYKNKLKFAIPTANETQYQIIEKKPGELLAHDYGNLDLWEKQTTEITSDHQRYRNKIPFWQRTMNNRHYDRGNQGFHHADPNRASLNVDVYGYDDEMKKLANLIDKKNKKNGVFSF